MVTWIGPALRIFAAAAERACPPEETLEDLLAKAQVPLIRVACVQSLHAAQSEWATDLCVRRRRARCSKRKTHKSAAQSKWATDLRHS